MVVVVVVVVCRTNGSYDYRGMAFGVDFFFVMAYSIQSQIFGRCIGCGNTYTQVGQGARPPLCQP